MNCETNSSNTTSLKVVKRTAGDVQRRPPIHGQCVTVCQTGRGALLYWLTTEEQGALNAQQPCTSRAACLQLEDKASQEPLISSTTPS